jgi:hypothetical protein
VRIIYQAPEDTTITLYNLNPAIGQNSKLSTRPSWLGITSTKSLEEVLARKADEWNISPTGGGDTQKVILIQLLSDGTLGSPNVYQWDTYTASFFKDGVRPTLEETSTPTSEAEYIPWFDSYPCMYEGDPGQTCWQYIDSNGNETTKDNAIAVWWIGPTDLSTDIWEYNNYGADRSEWYDWAASMGEMRFCIDTPGVGYVQGQVEQLSSGCYHWTRGPFRISLN